VKAEDWRILMAALSIRAQAVPFSKGTTQLEKDAIADYMIGVAEVIEAYPVPQYVKALSESADHLLGFMNRAIEYLNLAMLESFGGLRFTRKEQLDAAAEALRLLHEGLSHPPNCAKCRDRKVVERGAFLDDCPVCRPKNQEMSS
jgi:hypothetical protein